MKHGFAGMIQKQNSSCHTGNLCSCQVQNKTDKFSQVKGIWIISFNCNQDVMHHKIPPPPTKPNCQLAVLHSDIVSMGKHHEKWKYRNDLVCHDNVPDHKAQSLQHIMSRTKCLFIMKFSQTISWVRWFNFLEINISKTISVLVLLHS